jgi:hypothetical protein
VLVVSEGTDEEVGELVLDVANGIQGGGDQEFLAEVSPDPKEFVLCLAGLGSNGLVGIFERGVEFSSEDSWVLR